MGPITPFPFSDKSDLGRFGCTDSMEFFASLLRGLNLWFKCPWLYNLIILLSDIFNIYLHFPFLSKEIIVFYKVLLSNLERADFSPHNMICLHFDLLSPVHHKFAVWLLTPIFWYLHSRISVYILLRDSVLTWYFMMIWSSVIIQYYFNSPHIHHQTHLYCNVLLSVVSLT